MFRALRRQGLSSWRCLKNFGFYVVLGSIQEGARGGKNGIVRSFHHRPGPNTAPMGQHRANIGQHGPNIGPTWAQHSATWVQLGPTYAQDGPNLAQHGPDLAQHKPKMGARWLNIGPTWPNMGTTCAQHRPPSLEPTYCPACLTGARLSGVSLYCK